MGVQALGDGVGGGDAGFAGCCGACFDFGVLGSSFSCASFSEGTFLRRPQSMMTTVWQSMLQMVSVTGREKERENLLQAQRLRNCGILQ